MQGKVTVDAYLYDDDIWEFIKLLSKTLENSKFVTKFSLSLDLNEQSKEQ